MAALTPALFAEMMKDLYTSKRVESHAKKNRPLLQYLPRKDFEGDGYNVPLLYEDPQSVGHTFATVQTNQANAKQVKFRVDVDDIKTDYGFVKVQGKVIKATKSNVGSFLRAKDTQVMGMLRQLSKHLHLELYRGGSGSLGQIATGGIAGGGLVLTLTNKTDVHNFGVGQVLIANNTDDSTSMKTGDVAIVGRDVSAGTITVDQDVTGLGTPWAALDYLFTDGDQGAALSGLAAWLPPTAPGATTFFNVNRTADITRLSGHRVNKPAKTIYENAQELAVLISEEGGEPDTLFLNPRAGLQLAEEAGAKVERMEGGVAKFGFTGFSISNFAVGSLNIVFDIGCPPNRGYMLQRDTWELLHMDALPHVIMDDGNAALRGATTDDIEIRGRWFAQLVCSAPGWNGVMAVTI